MPSTGLSPLAACQTFLLCGPFLSLISVDFSGLSVAGSCESFFAQSSHADAQLPYDPDLCPDGHNVISYCSHQVALILARSIMSAEMDEWVR